MALYRIVDHKLVKADETTFAEEGINEKRDLQAMFVGQPEAIEPGLFVVADEFGMWEDSSRRIDILALDRDRRLVVIELKRADESSFMDLQAVRYAALVANMQLPQLIDAHRRHMQKHAIEGDAAERVLGALSFEDPSEAEVISRRPRILLVSATFSRELMTSVLWLNDVGCDITCVQLVPHKVDGEVLITTSTLVPLPEANDYLVRLREHAAEAEAGARQRMRRERTIAVLVREGVLAPGTQLVIFTGGLTQPDGFDLGRPECRARIGDNPMAQQNVVWEADGKPYSLSRLTESLRDQHEFPMAGGALNGYAHWSLAGDPTESLWDLAERLGRH